MASAVPVDHSRLIAALTDIERHVGSLGWDQPARLFALVPTAQLLELEPQLRGQVPESSPDALTAIEQDEFAAGMDVLERLNGIFFPQTVEGAAIAMERSFLPPQYEAEIPAEEAAAVDFVHTHPQRMDVRVVVGALRDGTRHGVARVLSDPEELLGGEDLVPGLAEVLAKTLEETP